jgi:hypothetical protein
MDCNSIRSQYNWDKLGFGCSVSHSRKGREGLSLPGGCSSPAKGPTESRHRRAAAVAQSCRVN